MKIYPVGKELMGLSCQDYSGVPDFEADFPKNVGLKILKWTHYKSFYAMFPLNFDYQRKNDYFELEIVKIL